MQKELNVLTWSKVPVRITVVGSVCGLGTEWAKDQTITTRGLKYHRNTASCRSPMTMKYGTVQRTLLRIFNFAHVYNFKFTRSAPAWASTSLYFNTHSYTAFHDHLGWPNLIRTRINCEYTNFLLADHTLRTHGQFKFLSEMGSIKLWFKHDQWEKFKLSPAEQNGDLGRD